MDFKNVANNYFNAAALSPATAYPQYPAAFRSYPAAYGYHPTAAAAAAAASTMDYTLQYASGTAPYCIGTLGSDPWKLSMNNN